MTLIKIILNNTLCDHAVIYSVSHHFLYLP